MAEALGLNPSVVDKPKEGFLFLQIVDRKTWQKKRGREGVNFNGKAKCLKHFNTKFLIDDNLDIVEECCDSGIVAYKCEPSRVWNWPKRRKEDEEHVYAQFVKDQLEHVSGASFAETCDAAVEDRRSGNLWRKLRVVERCRRF